MVFKKTEYVRAFKPRALQQNLSVYSEYLGYRAARRQQEHAHSAEDFSWDTPRSSSTADTPRSPPASEQRQEDEDVGGSVEAVASSPPAKTVQQSLTGTNDVAGQIVKEMCAKQARGKQTSTDKMCAKEGRQDRKARPLSAPASRDVPTWSRSGPARTFNVRGNVDVYPSALRAQKRRQAEISGRKESQVNAASWQKRQRALFNEQVRRETSGWCSEYRSRFAGYDALQVKVSSARPLTATRPPHKVLCVWQ